MKHMPLLRTRFFVLILAADAFTVTGAFGWMISQRSAALDGSVSQLRDMGSKIATAVLKHDIETLLTYDRPDLRLEDRLELQDTKSNLYCFLFDRRCDANGRPSVDDILSSARRLDVEVQVLRGEGRPLYGLLLFFDATKVRKTRLRSASFQCQLSRRDQIVSWLFRLDDGAWVSAHPPFDFETDTLCSPQ